MLATTLTNGAAEELFFRGALYDAAGRRAAPVSTAAYMLATTATRNPALVLASGVMGALFAWQRRATGGVQAPLLTHLTWSALMLRFLPPLFGADGGRELRQPDQQPVDVGIVDVGREPHPQPAGVAQTEQTGRLDRVERPGGGVDTPLGEERVGLLLAPARRRATGSACGGPPGSAR